MSTPTGLEVLFTPADFKALEKQDLSQTTCVVFDVLRATSSIIAALANGANAILPCGDIPEALTAQRNNPGMLLAGERNGFRITSTLTGGVDFDLGNSPREFTRDKVAARSIVITTTNGTRALRACARAKMVFVGALLNLTATAQALKNEKPKHVLLICSGTHERPAYEDVLGAGALCDLIGREFPAETIVDSAMMARQLYLNAKSDLVAALKNSENGKRLLTIPDLQADIEFCAQRDKLQIVPVLGKDGFLRLLSRAVV